MKSSFDAAGNVVLVVGRQDACYLDLAKGVARRKLREAQRVITHRGVKILKNPTGEDLVGLLTHNFTRRTGKGVVDLNGDHHAWSDPNIPHEEIAGKLGLRDGEWGGLHHSIRDDDGLRSSLVTSYAHYAPEHKEAIMSHAADTVDYLRGVQKPTTEAVESLEEAPAPDEEIVSGADVAPELKDDERRRHNKLGRQYQNPKWNNSVFVQTVLDHDLRAKNPLPADQLPKGVTPYDEGQHVYLYHVKDGQIHGALHGEVSGKGMYIHHLGSTATGGGAALLGRAEAEAKRRGLLYTSGDMATSSLAPFYKKNGYEVGPGNAITKEFTESVQPLLEAGFTGIVHATNGVDYHYVDGKRVPSGHAQAASGAVVHHATAADDKAADAWAASVKHLKHTVAGVLHNGPKTMAQIISDMQGGNPTAKHTGKYGNAVRDAIRDGTVVKVGNTYRLANQVNAPATRPVQPASPAKPQYQNHAKLWGMGFDQAKAKSVMANGRTHHEFFSLGSSASLGMTYTEFYSAVGDIAKGAYTGVAQPAPAAPAAPATPKNPYSPTSLGGILFDIVAANPGLTPKQIVAKIANPGPTHGKWGNALNSMAAKGHLVKGMGGRFSLGTGTPPAPAAATPAASTAPTGKATLPAIPYKDETVFTTGKAQSNSLNGIDFASAPPKFWEKVKDVDLDEPPPARTINRAGVLIQEPDGRIWIVQPTNQFGNRKHTLPGGGVEAGLSVQQNALKEVWEETGLQVEITGFVGDFTDSNNGNNGRLYIGKRVGGAPWDAKIEQTIRDNKTGKPAAESETVTLVTPEKAAKLLHRTDDLAQLGAAHALPVNTPTKGSGSEPLKKILGAIQPAVEAYKKKQRRAGASVGNAELHVVQNLRGFNKHPTVAKKKDIDALVSAGTHIEVLRGIKDVGGFSAKDLAEQYRSGVHYPGYGCFGSGTYTDSNKHGNKAADYAGYRGGEILRIAIPKTAKIIKQSELERKVADNPDLFTGYSSAGGHSAHECWWGVQAALAGYDAIEVDGNSSRHGSYGKGFYVILNRAITTVQDTGVPRSYKIK